MVDEKCESCRLRYVCEDQAAFICKQRHYCDYSPDPKQVSSESTKHEELSTISMREKLGSMIMQEVYSGGMICDHATYLHLVNTFNEIADRLIAKGVRLVPIDEVTPSDER